MQDQTICFTKAIDIVLDKYFIELSGALQILDTKPIKKAVTAIHDAYLRKSMVFIFGNGGSASTAEHFAADLRKYAGGIRAIALTLMPLLTAYGNDAHYTEIFRLQLDTMLEPGDVAVGISCSGTSRNVLGGLSLARSRGVTTIGLTGHSDKTPIYSVSNIAILAPAREIKKQEDIHLAVCHAIAGELREKINK